MLWWQMNLSVIARSFFFYQYFAKYPLQTTDCIVEEMIWDEKGMTTINPWKEIVRAGEQPALKACVFF